MEADGDWPPGWCEHPTHTRHRSHATAPSESIRQRPGDDPTRLSFPRARHGERERLLEYVATRSPLRCWHVRVSALHTTGFFDLLLPSLSEAAYLRLELARPCFWMIFPWAFSRAERSKRGLSLLVPQRLTGILGKNGHYSILSLFNLAHALDYGLVWWPATADHTTHACITACRSKCW